MRAEVAELVDALGSGSSGRTLVMVQVHSSAPLENEGLADSLVSPFLYLRVLGQHIYFYLCRSYGIHNYPVQFKIVTYIRSERGAHCNAADEE